MKPARTRRPPLPRGRPSRNRSKGRAKGAPPFAFADVDPDAKRAAACNVEGAFGVDMSRIAAEDMGAQAPAPEPAITFTADRLRAMLAVAERVEPRA